MKLIFFKNLNLTEYATLVYLMLTGFFITLNFSVINIAWLHLLARLFMIFVVFYLSRKRQLFTEKPLPLFLSQVYPLFFLAYLYPETDALNNIFYQNLDMNFIIIEFQLFGYQPSIEFYKHFHSPWLIELMSLGYFSYYLLIFGSVLWIYFKNKTSFDSALFIISSSFYIYYIIFIIFPVVGPQFFFSASDSFVGEAGPFRWLMRWIEYFGERPTGAFPSSHVGITLIIMILIYKEQKLFSLILLPVFILLIISTVYMKAHYFVDVFAGLISGLLLYTLFNFIFQSVKKKNIIFSKSDQITTV